MNPTITSDCSKRNSVCSKNCRLFLKKTVYGSKNCNDKEIDYGGERFRISVQFYGPNILLYRRGIPQTDNVTKSLYDKNHEIFSIGDDPRIPDYLSVNLIMQNAHQ